MAEKFSPSRKSKESDPYLPGDVLPSPEVVERGESAWGLFEALARQQEARFAKTAPMGLTGGENAGLARSEPLKGGAGRGPATLQVFSLETAMLIARKNNRVCPRPKRWTELMALLPARKTLRGVQHPAAPVTGPAWFVTPALTKRVCFREHVEWAEREGVLESVIAFMQALPEEDWLHMGED